MKIDIHTLAVVLSLNNVMHVVALFLQYRLNKNQNGLKCWSSGSLFLALGYSFNYLRDIPTVGKIMIISNNAMFVLGLALFYIGIERFFNQYRRNDKLIAFCAIIIIFSAYFTYLNDSLAFRRINLSIGLAVISFLIARALLLYRTQSVLTSVYFLASIFLINGTFFAIRALNPFIVGSVGDIFTPSTMQITTYMFVFITSTLWTFGFVLLVNHQDVRNLKDAQRALTESNRKLELLTITDGLTGIANRRHFDEVLVNEYDRHIRSNGELSLIMLDIDYFKKFNDSYGHIKGDECLKKIANLIAKCATRPADLAARYGGEEFACILPETNNRGAIAVAEKIRNDVIKAGIAHNGSEIADYVTVSLGVITLQCAPDLSPKEVVKQADKMLYRAKLLGRNRVESITSGNEINRSNIFEIKENFICLVWRDTFCCGNDLIDSQHKSLFNRANQLLETLFSSHPTTSIMPEVTKLIEEVEHHFKDEEAILKKIDFPTLSQHASSHNRLLSRALKLLEDLKNSDSTTDDLLKFLIQEMIMKHMLILDGEYFQFIKEK